MRGMRPLFHPSIDEVTVEAILHALADPVRVAIYAEIIRSGCSRSCSSLLNVSEKAVPKSTLSQHFNVLRAAGLNRYESAPRAITGRIFSPSISARTADTACRSRPWRACALKKMNPAGLKLNTDKATSRRPDLLEARDHGIHFATQGGLQR